ncbi:hypothetical protein C2857_005617 [Epichloe festucae Fl1]|uniref:Uncharacterized protein n=1 Tax=Epichloe festucae (strain Fl1) TaxID=877507 RepID=A0A7S9PSE2_EPIFF|nr:hypothetical protein C2857_005617 [Epichloe festucae Fl1]
MSITSGVSGIFKSIYDLFASLLATIFAVLQGAVSAAQGFIVCIVDVVQDVISQAVHLTSGVAKFVASNFIALAVGGLLVFAYLRYSANSRQAVAGKKTQ